MRKIIDRMDDDMKLLFIGFGVYGLVYLTIKLVEVIFGVAI